MNSMRPPKVPRPYPLPRVRNPLLDAMSPAEVSRFLDELDRLPLVAPAGDGHTLVTFCWRQADAEAVLLFANRLTDESDLDGTLLERKPGTGLWHASYRMPSAWRASYSFLVAGPGGPSPWQVDGHVELRAALDRGALDPGNPDTCTNRAGMIQSVVSLPGAPAQPWQAPRPGVVRGTLAEARAPGDRRAWLWDPPGAAAGRALPLVVVLDGEVWIGPQQLPATFDNLHADRATPAFRAVLLSSGGIDNRWSEMGADGNAVAYVVEHLVPWVRTVRRCTPETTVVGQSLGGLTALRAGLAHPEVVTGVVSQSASLWLDDLSGLAEHRVPTRIHLSHGAQEWVLTRPHDDLAQRLERARTPILAARYEGGHDYAWWRGALADGLVQLLHGPSRPGP